MEGTRSWPGIAVTALPVLFLIFDSVIKLIVIAPVVSSLGELGYPVRLARTIGAIELACLALYVAPRTSPIGAILLTGFLGGGVASHLRIESPLPSHTVFPVYVGILIWAGLWLRDARLRDLILRRG